MNIWPQVERLIDGESLNSETLNRPVDQLASRTEYLKRQLIGSRNSSLILYDVDLEEEEMSPGDVVFRGEHGFVKAKADMHVFDDFRAANSALTLGILIRVDEDTGDVLTYGKMDTGTGTGISISGMIQSGETYRPGRYYLSSVEAGKITSYPNGPLVYVGSFHDEDSAAYVNPQFLDIGTSHVHRAFPLVARPAGEAENGHVIGHLPIGASESSSSDSSSSSDDRSRLPTLIFGGTWTSTEDITYRFTLSGTTWGNVFLSWTKNGGAASSSVKIPGSGVFVDLDNGLKVKVMFPEATSSTAYSGLSEEERTWILPMPYAGRGWVDHSVDAVASETRDPASGRNSRMHVLISGSFPTNGKVTCRFPDYISMLVVSEEDEYVTVGSEQTTYLFPLPGSSSELPEGILVDRGTTVAETLLNVSSKDMSIHGSARVVASGNTLVGFVPVAGGTSSSYGTFEVLGGTVPCMVIYDSRLEVLGGIRTNFPSFVPQDMGEFTATAYATGVSASDKCEYRPGIDSDPQTEIYDHAPQAAYDYVMGLDQQIDYYYPPVPAQAAGLFVNGVELESSALHPDYPSYIIGHKTLHWIKGSDPWWRPWPYDITSRFGTVDPDVDKTMDFHFVVGFQGATGPVTSLVPAPGSQIKLYAYGTNDEAYTGDLMIDAALDFSVTDAGEAGYKVPKRGKGGKLLAGPVVERIKAGNGIIVTQSAGCPSGQGTVTIGLDDGTMRGHFNEIALENAKQEKLGLFPYVSLLGWGESGNIPSAFTMMTRVASNLDPEKSYQLQLRMVMFGTAGYTSSSQRAAGIQLEYNILPDYTDRTHQSLKTGLLVPDLARQIAVPLGHASGGQYTYTSYDPFVATTDVNAVKIPDVCVALSSLPIPTVSEFSQQGKTKDTVKLAPGYLVAVRISRTATPTSQGSSYDAYTAPVGFLSMEWTLEEC